LEGTVSWGETMIIDGPPLGTGPCDAKNKDQLSARLEAVLSCSIHILYNRAAGDFSFDTSLEYVEFNLANHHHTRPG
jgi:hypothetical protein